MNPAVAELVRQIEGDILSCSENAGTPRDGSVVLRLRQDLHDAIYERVMLEALDGPEDHAVTFAGFPIVRGAMEMTDAWRFVNHAMLPKRPTGST